MWAYESVFYQIYPFGACGAPFENDHVLEHRIHKLEDFIPHLKKLNIDCILLNPIFESRTHGYDTTDFKTLDTRLGTNEDLKEVVNQFHENGIQIILDAVFNHVGRDFFAFQDVLERSGIHLIRIGSILILMETITTTMASGTRIGKAMTS